MKWKTVRRLPHLELHLEIPFVTIHTEVLCRRTATMYMDWIVLHVQVWRWKAAVGLYSPYRQLCEDDTSGRGGK